MSTRTTPESADDIAEIGVPSRLRSSSRGDGPDGSMMGTRGAATGQLES